MVASGFDRSAAGLAGAGQRLARELSARHIVLACAAEGSPAAQSLARVADEAHLLQSPDLEAGQSEAWLGAIESFANIQKPAAVLLGSDTVSQELTPVLAWRLGGASVGDAQKLVVEDGKIRVARSVYGGKATAVLELQRTPAVIWVRSRSMEPADEGEAGKICAVESGAPAALELRMIERSAEDAQGERLEDAPLIVAGGRGLGGPEPFEQLKELASVMNAQMAASRAACDFGWVPYS
ncbi:MAG: electron transfer flavoprotein subunit alpha/FixB family protein, partial [Pirellulales bacterium]